MSIAGESRADRFAIAAVLWTVAAGVALALLPLGESSTGTNIAGVFVESTTRHSLLESEGATILIPLAIPTLLASLALIVRLRPMRLASGALLLAFCVLGAMSIGVYFLPAAVLLLVAGSQQPTAPKGT